MIGPNVLTAVEASKFVSAILSMHLSLFDFNGCACAIRIKIPVHSASNGTHTMKVAL